MSFLLDTHAAWDYWRGQSSRFPANTLTCLAEVAAGDLAVSKITLVEVAR